MRLTTGFDVLDAETGSVRREIPGPAGSIPQAIRWSPDGLALYATGMNGPAQFWIARLGANGREHLIWRSQNTWPGELAISPDGGTFAVTSLRFTTELWIIEHH